MAVSDKSGGGDSSKEGFLFGNKGNIFKSQRSLQELTVTNAVIAPPPLPAEIFGTIGGGRHHVAWTSIPQERWEGELVAQGQIPLWLVCMPYEYFTLFLNLLATFK